MEEKKSTINISVEGDNIEKVIRVMSAIMEATSKFEKKDNIEEPEPNVFQPKEGDICTCDIGGNIDSIFRYTGKIRTDEDGITLLDGDPVLTWSGNLFKPYMVIHGEGPGQARDQCRLSTEDEKKFFQDKVKESKEAKKEEKKWKVGDLVYIVGCEAGCHAAFYPVPVIYKESTTSDNLIRRGWMFDNESDCETLCEKLNEAIDNINLK